MAGLLRIKRSIENAVWSVTFILDLTVMPESDKALMNKFGEPSFEIGGEYLSGTEDVYTLPLKTLRLRSDLPYTQSFDSKSPDFSENTQLKAEAFQTKFVDDYVAALVALRERADTYTGEYTVNL